VRVEEELYVTWDESEKMSNLSFRWVQSPLTPVSIKENGQYLRNSLTLFKKESSGVNMILIISHVHLRVDISSRITGHSHIVFSYY
jgi:hypothetical protein